MAKQKKQTAKDAGVESRKPRKTLAALSLPRWVFWAAAAIVVLGMVYVRVSHLSNDPPVDIFWSQDLWTDPPQYTSYARNAALFGDWNPLHDPRLVLFVKNTTGALAYVVFSLFGVGFWQSNLVGVLFNLGTVVLLSLALARLKGRLAGLLCALLLGTNYILLTYGRLPFLENAMNFWLALAVFFLSFGLPRPSTSTPGGLIRRNLSEGGWFFAAGVSCAVAALFGKMIALHALPAFVLVAAYAGWRSSGASTRKWFAPTGYFVAGFAVLTVFWFLYACLPAGGNIRKYLAEQSTGLYGSPEGLQSVRGFFNRLFSFGSDTRLFVRSPIVAVFGFVGAAIAFLPLACKGRFAERLRTIKPEYLLVGLWFWMAYLALMPWNYRPLRYETVLLIPLTGAAAMVLNDIVRRLKTSPERAGDVSMPLAVTLGAALFILPVHHLVTAPFAKPQMGQTHTLFAVLAVLIAVAGAFLFAAGRGGIVSGWRRITQATRVPEIVVALSVIVSLAVQGRMIAGWWQHEQKATTSASRELAEILGPDAVLVGSYATGLTLENRLKNIVYMFGVAQVNATLFHDFPITHLAIIDDKNDRVFSDYGDITRRAQRVTSFMIGNRPVGIFRVAENSPNETARAYRLTAYEHAMRCYEQYKMDSMLMFIDQFAEEHPDNFALARFRGLYYLNEYTRDSTHVTALDSAEFWFQKAARVYPDDYAVHHRLAECEMELFKETRNPAHLQLAQEQFREVLRLVPNDPVLRAKLEPIIGR